MTLLLPSNREEGWRWSDLSALPDLASRSASGLAPADLPWIDGVPDGARLLFVDGVFQSERSRLGPIEVGEVGNDSDHPLGRLAGRSGWRLSLGKGHSPGALVQIVHLSTGSADHAAATIELDEEAQASIVETFVGEGWTNRAAHIRLFRGARLMLHRRLLGASGFVSLTDRAEVGEAASLVVAMLAAGGTDSRIDGRYELAGTGAYAEVAAALLARGRQRHDANLAIAHRVANGTSRQIWRSVAGGQGACSVAARVEVARHAQKSDAEQSLKGLLLDRSATINAKPELEIFADDVKCAHGATVGELDRAALFYLQSRGVEPGEAQALLTRAFVADALDRIGDEPVREAFQTDAESWFG